jgi:hypothetical protein
VTPVTFPAADLGQECAVMRRSVTVLLAALGALCASIAAESADQLVLGNEVTFEWSRATGPVDRYGIWLSVNGEPFLDEPDFETADTRITLVGETSTLVAVRVAALDSERRRGPFSRTSRNIVFLENDPGALADRPAHGAADYHSYDFDDDGHSDLVFRNPASGLVSVWLMSGVGPWHRAELGFVPLHWELVGSDDFDGDGRADLLWREPRTGSMRLWQVEEAFLRAETSFPGPDDATPSIVGDLDGDGSADLVFRRAGTTTVWPMASDGPRGEVTLPAPPGNRRLACSADFDGDGDLDLLWQPTAPGPPILWRMDAGALEEAISLAGFAGGNWEAASCSDTNSDGHADVVWRNPDNEALTVWALQDAAITTVAAVTGIDPSWAALAAGDYDGDGVLNEFFLQDAAGRQQIRRLTWTGADTVAASDHPAGTSPTLALQLERR